jgi:uncharacterized protein (DUF2141 family)
VWCYPSGRVPDSTARDFDALGLADDGGHFRVVGLTVPGTYRLYVFLDVNRNRSFEPESDVLAPAETTFVLTAEKPHATDVELVAVNPRAPGRVGGAVLDSLAGDAHSRLIAVFAADTGRVVDVPCDAQRHFRVELAAGEWRLRAYRDTNGNGRWDARVEPASPPYAVEVKPALEIPNIRLIVEPAPSQGP